MVKLNLLAPATAVLVAAFCQDDDCGLLWRIYWEVNLAISEEDEDIMLNVLLLQELDGRPKVRAAAPFKLDACRIINWEGILIRVLFTAMDFSIALDEIESIRAKCLQKSIKLSEEL